MPRQVYDVTAATGAVPDRALLEEVVTRIVDAVAPERIILFGSAARGTMGPHSDLDLLVVTSHPDESGDADAAIRRALRPVQVEFDLVVATPDDLERYGRSIGLVYKAALEEGRELYRGASREDGSSARPGTSAAPHGQRYRTSSAPFDTVRLFPSPERLSRRSSCHVSPSP